MEEDEGRVRVYGGNWGAYWGCALRPRQLRTDDNRAIAPLGRSNSFTEVGLRLMLYMPLGVSDVRLQWQAAPLGVSFTDPSAIEGTGSSWERTHWEGLRKCGHEIVDGLTAGIPYHWRVRLVYLPGNRLGQVASRWVHMPWNDWNETDFRTRGYHTVYLPLVVHDP
jgi:hypothetical protein